MSQISLLELMDSDLLDTYDSRDTITQIKAAAIRDLGSLDSRMGIHSTQYFNHSFAPDLVLTWPHGKTLERYVYLRSSSRPEELTEEVRRLGDQHPIVLGLVTLGGSKQAEDQELEIHALDHETLVTDPVAIATMNNVKLREPIAGLFSAALMQGGRGLINEREAQHVTSVVAAGFNAARTMGTGPVARATNTVQSRLAPNFASDFIRMLQAVWIGSGGRSDLFPASNLELTSGVDDDSLQFLLDLNLIEDTSFWRHIGRFVTVSQLGRLTAATSNENLQFLVASNLDHLRARVCRLEHREPQFDDLETADRLLWFIEKNTLALRGHSWAAFVAERADDLGASNVEPAITLGISVGELRKRARETRIVSLQLSDGEVELDLNSPRLANVVRSTHLDAVERSFGSTAKVQRARAVVSDRQVACDFSHSSASLIGPNAINMSRLLKASLPLLRPLSDDEVRALDVLLQGEESNQEQLELDLDDPPVSIRRPPPIATRGERDLGSGQRRLLWNPRDRQRSIEGAQPHRTEEDDPGHGPESS